MASCGGMAFRQVFGAATPDDMFQFARNGAAINSHPACVCFCISPGTCPSNARITSYFQPFTDDPSPTGNDTKRASQRLYAKDESCECPAITRRIQVWATDGERP
jgi:hypothetical protein